MLLMQTDDIHESFYDLFNQNFRRIDDPKSKNDPRYYANVAIGANIKPSRININFQCIVVIKASEIDNTPAPFLDRFEKYYISHEILLNAALSNLPPFMRAIVQDVYAKVSLKACVFSAKFANRSTTFLTHRRKQAFMVPIQKLLVHYCLVHFLSQITHIRITLVHLHYLPLKVMIVLLKPF